jgi:quercetin dioxygenase-like cupin family protein
MKSYLAAAAAFALSLSPAVAGESDSALPSGFAAEPVLKSSATADGDAFAYPQSGKPEIVSVIGVVEPGGRTARHQHPVPVYVYLLEGELEVQTEGKEVRHYRAGEAFLESIGHWHQAFNNGKTATKILVVFVGEEGKPTTVSSQ